MLLLTGLLRNEIINCYDGTHTRDELKKWCKKRIILCPACGNPYEYCHGKIKIPYFRHADKTMCQDKYGEPETEEHLIGKRDLFIWIKAQDDVTDAVLEGWIPETKQRPDIMFKYHNKLYVIEYQCSPISSEWIERHDLYQAAGIHDIWICGTEKYLKDNMREKFLQNKAFGFYDSKNHILISSHHQKYYSEMKNIGQLYSHSKCKFYGFDLNAYGFDGKIYNSLFGDIDTVLKKRSIRKSKKQPVNRQAGYYLDLQTEKLLSKLSNNLHKLSNVNWKFYIKTYKNNYGVYRLLDVKPIIQTYYQYEIDERYYKTRKRIKLYSMDYCEFKKCAENIDALKQLLLPVMEYNKEELLRYNNKDIRVLEVRHE